MSTTADVNHIFKTVNAISNKEQKGYLKPSEFNTMLQQAELEIFEENYHKTANPNKLQRGFESDLDRTDSLIPYLRKVTGTASGASLESNYVHLVGVYSSGKEVKFVRHSEFGKVINSTIIAPTTDSPIYTISPSAASSSTPATKLNFYTSTSGPNDMIYAIVYLARPTVPANGHYVVNSLTGLVDLALCTALDAPKSEHTKITNKVLQYLGIHLKDGDLVSYASSELTKE